jgi:hypothetical protein
VCRALKKDLEVWPSSSVVPIAGIGTVLKEDPVPFMSALQYFLARDTSVIVAAMTHHGAAADEYPAFSAFMDKLSHAETLVAFGAERGRFLRNFLLFCFFVLCAEFNGEFETPSSAWFDMPRLTGLWSPRRSDEIDLQVRQRARILDAARARRRAGNVPKSWQHKVNAFETFGVFEC